MCEDYNTAAFRLLVEVRGGLPACCDYCGKPYTPARWPVPEEAGAWSCSECERPLECPP